MGHDVHIAVRRKLLDDGMQKVHWDGNTRYSHLVPLKPHGAKIMIRRVITLAVGLLTAIALSGPSLAVSQGKAKACEAKAEKKRPALTAGEKEAYIANCKANAS
jgi:hypothetical protein